MKKTSTKTAKSVVETVPVAVAVAVKAPKTKAPKAEKKEAEKKETVEVVETVEVATPEVAVEEDVGASLQKSIADLQEQLASLKTATAAAATALKTIEKQATRLAKKADRRRKRKAEAVEGAEPKPCIFTKPVKITAELCSFLGKPKDTEVSRSSVTKGVMEYARNHSLMDKQTIKADAALRKLLTLAEGDVLTILNLQKYLRRHYVKAVVA
jgi:chromatin remodeling complex protein RSC6